MAERVHIGETRSGAAYDIVIASDFHLLGEELEAIGLGGRKALIVTDDNVSPLYLSEVQELFNGPCSFVANIVIPAGEEEKHLDNVRKILHKLIKEHFDRKDFLVALGGGVIGDMAGFASAVYLRGVRFIQLPTTLLSQTDSSIGGKTGVDFDAFKNMVGAFHQPSLVYMNMGSLKTLPAIEFSSGMAEIIKHGLIRDSEYFRFLGEEAEAIGKQDIRALSRMIKRSCEIKAEVVELDPMEEGLRAILNFGHTLGHAIEKYKDFSLKHGQCVAIGIMAALRLSLARGYIQEGDFDAARRVLELFSLPVVLDKDTDVDKIISISRMDKKMDKGQIRFILLKAIGEAYIDTAVTEDEMRQALIGLMEW
ncbi:MAG: 3-dehydroquinate synthase [Lachnospiraceae bacterium]|nr:3-dehydroquinate synthase [Lachnospiraceae bacterium]